MIYVLANTMKPLLSNLESTKKMFRCQATTAQRQCVRSVYARCDSQWSLDSGTFFHSGAWDARAWLVITGGKFLDLEFSVSASNLVAAFPKSLLISALIFVLEMLKLAGVLRLRQHVSAPNTFESLKVSSVHTPRNEKDLLFDHCSSVLHSSS